MLCREFSLRRQAEEDFAELAEFAALTPEPNVQTTQEPSPQVQTTQEPAPQVQTTAEPEHTVNIPLLRQRNPHCIGWIRIPGTRIDYPLMHTPDQPQYYLRRNFDGLYSVAGTPFLDHACTLESENLIIYGHNMNDGSMFAALHSYVEEEFRREHCVIELETEKGCAYYEVIHVRRVDMTDPWYSFGREPGQGQYITLSTCVGGDPDGRLMVIGQRIQ